MRPIEDIQQSETDEILNAHSTETGYIIAKQSVNIIILGNVSQHNPGLTFKRLRIHLQIN